MQRHHKNELLEALVTGREQLVEKAAQSRSTAPRGVPREEAIREPAPQREPAAPAPG